LSYIKQEKMRIINLAAVVIFLTIFSLSCTKRGTWGIKGQGSDLTELRSVTGFSGIKLCCDANIVYIVDSVYRVEVTGQKNVLAVLETSLQGSDLNIDFKRNVWSHNTINIVIHSPSINKMNVSGSGKISSQSTLNASAIELVISGSGNISIQTVSVQSLTSRLSGSGSIRINEGTTSNENFSIRGSGSIQTEFVKASTSLLNISGSGNMYVHVSDKINIDISGSGSVYYRGKPSINFNGSGSGKVIGLD
jgi:hypothetical protein